jgi:DNA replication and repair protein RecF
MHLAQSDPLYVHHLFRFWRAMKQRNSLLRLSNQEGIECWEAEMSFAAAYLFNERLHLIEELNQALLLSCQTLSAEPLQLRFTSTYPAKSEDYLALLRKNRTKEQQLGLTLHGPHRDDFTLFVEQKPARQFASEGQKRTALASLRLAEWKRLQQQAHVSPILGIDDFELHLDQERQRLFQAALEELGQVFVSTPELKPSWASAKHFTISSGKIVN